MDCEKHSTIVYSSVEKLVLFDFDRTLLNTDSLKAEQALRIAKITGLSIEQVLEGMNGYIASIPCKNDFTPQGYAEFLRNQYGASVSDILKIYITVPSYVVNFLYADALPVLAELKARGMKLGIFSEARKEHQKMKIDRTGVLEYTDKKYVIVVTKKVIDEIVKPLPKGTIIVDDDRGVVDGLFTYAPQIIPVWLNRKTTEVHPAVKTIFSLTEFLQLELV